MGILGNVGVDRYLGHSTVVDAHHPIEWQETRLAGFFMHHGWRSATTTAFQASKLAGQPFYMPRDKTADRIAVNITTADAGKVIRLGIYNGDGADLYPGSLLLDAGTVDASSTGVKTISINQSMPKGLYFLAQCSDGTPTTKMFEPTYSPLGDQRAGMDGYADVCWMVTFTYAALPDPFTAGGAIQPYGSGGTIVLRFSSMD